MTEATPKATPTEPVDLTNCDREPIHLLGGVQQYGCLVATSSDFMINHVSDNVATILGLDPQGAIGSRLLDQLPAETVHDLRTKLQILNVTSNNARLFGYDVMGDGRKFDVSLHAQGQKYIFEFEPKRDTGNRDEMSLVQPLLARVTRAKDIVAACDQAAMAIKVLSGFDRVMVYRFDDDGAGQVIAEQREPNMEPFIGLRYPASDIPKQARALYLRSLLRLIADVDAPVSPIRPAASIDGKPLDLSLAVTRAVSPIHLEYLRNMGVAASMSVSIVRNGELWGLFSCHHQTPRVVDFERRTAIELFAQFFAYELGQKLDSVSRQESQTSRRVHDRLMIQVSGGTNLVDGFEGIANELSEFIQADGIAIYSGGRYAARGEAPSAEEFYRLVRFLNTAPTGKVFSTDRLAEAFEPSRHYGADIAGLMAVPISRTPRDYIVFFRREIARSVRWAGNPEKPVEVGPNGLRLTPRKSFETWTELVRGTSARWSEGEIAAAEALRVSLIEIVLKLTDEANENQRKFAEKQELLIAELNHRVRNILNLIQGLVSQSRSEAMDVAGYTRVLGGRIQAMARAHDQLTRQGWAATSLRDLMAVEVGAYLAGQGERFIVSGDSPMLNPDAFSTIALVVHEMVTNSAKYGAFTDQSGKVTVHLDLQRDGSLMIAWREVGGPAVQAPSRRGFGTTIIERTIPYELGGTVATRYKLTGFEADIMLPSSAIAPEQAPSGALPEAAVHAADHDAWLSGEMLVVEDNMIAAMDASDVLMDHGAARVHMASSVKDALSLLDNHDIGFALLDVNLGSQTSLPVATELIRRNIPFVLATGYGDAESVTGSYPAVPFVSKPFTVEHLLAAVRLAIG